MGRNDQKTEKPTPRRRREARKDGQVARSAELAGWLPLFLASSLLPAFLRSATSRMVSLEALGANIISHPDPSGAWRMLDAGLGTAAVIVAPVMGAALLVGLVVNVGQVGLRVSGRALRPRFSRLSPLTGLRRLFSFHGGIWEGGKAVLKLAVISTVAGQSLAHLVAGLAASASPDLGSTAAMVGIAALGLVRNVAVAGLAMGALDYLLARRKWLAGLRMTRQEVRDELRQADGDPNIRARIRQAQRRLSRMRMMAEVSRAHVVAVNPTHYAVALRYDAGVASAPRVVAKGADQVALRIREIALRDGVPVVEDPPLARAVHAACEIDDVIPAHLYLAVARLLAFVYSLPPLARGSAVSHSTPAAALAAPAAA